MANGRPEGSKPTTEMISKIKRKLSAMGAGGDCLAETALTKFQKTSSQESIPQGESGSGDSSQNQKGETGSGGSSQNQKGTKRKRPNYKRSQGDALSLQKKRELAPQTACNQAFTSCTTVELFGFVILQRQWPLCNYGTLPQLRLLLFLRLNGS